ncbi:hypothetical protein NE479_12305, partial [Phascolarctobacterium faecium]|uniref:hypothetical protein n=1 Tax=Phascolarctobacterium faecium TaxID=33025 RepID=UPI00210A44B6
MVSSMNDGAQEILSGGSGMVCTMSGGWQMITSGVCMVSIMSSGNQIVLSSCEGTVSTMNSCYLKISSGGTGT